MQVWWFLCYIKNEKYNLYFNQFLYIRLQTFHVPLTSHVATAAAGTIHVSMEEPALRSVSPQMFGTTVPVLYRLSVNTARFSWEEAVRIIKQPVSPPLDCTPSLMTETKLSKYSVILILSLGSHGTWLSHSICPTTTFLR